MTRFFFWSIGLPFLGAGGLVLHSLLTGYGRTGHPFLAAAGAAAFLIVGVVMLVAGWRVPRAVAKEERLRDRYPGQPWKWREDWASGAVRSEGRHGAVALVIVALLWNLVSAPIPVILPQELAKGNRLAWIGLVFPLAGVWLIYAAARAIIHTRKYGIPVFQLDGETGVVGGVLQGFVRSPGQVTQTGEGKGALRCLQRYVSGSGDSRSVHERVLWESEQKLPRGSGSLAAGLPLRFEIPIECDETRETPADDRIVWRLSVEIPTPGVDFSPIFEVPVFKTGAGNPEQTRRVVEKRSLLGDSTERPAGDRRILVSTTGDTAEFVFPAARNRTAATVTTVIALGLCGVTFALYGNAPLIFPLLLALVALAATAAAAYMWLHSSRVVVRPGRIEIAHALLGMTKTNALAAQDIQTIETRIGMEAQHGNKHSVWYDIKVACRNGRSHVAGASIRSKAEAEWLANEMRSKLGQGE